MKEVRTQKRYKCDFCKKRGIKRKIEWHEKQCYRNPNRVCQNCNNTGKVEMYENGTSYRLDCVYCKSFDKEKIKQIEAREKGEYLPAMPKVEASSLPF